MQPSEISVLLVDDELLSRTIVGNLLRKCGYLVTVCDSGAAALDVLQRSSPGTFQLILTDVMMPEVDGLDILRYVRSNTQLADLPVIMMSANEQKDTVFQAIRSGAEEYLVKPVTKKEVQNIWQYVWKRLTASHARQEQQQVELQQHNGSWAPGAPQQQQQQVQQHQVQQQQLAQQQELLHSMKQLHRQQQSVVLQPEPQRTQQQQQQAGSASASASGQVLLSQWLRRPRRALNAREGRWLFCEVLMMLQRLASSPCGVPPGLVCPSRLLLHSSGCISPAPAAAAGSAPADAREEQLYQSPEAAAAAAAAAAGGAALAPSSAAADASYCLGLLLLDLLHVPPPGSSRLEALAAARQGQLPAGFEAAQPQEAGLVRALLSSEPAARPSVAALVGSELLAGCCEALQERHRQQAAAVATQAAAQQEQGGCAASSGAALGPAPAAADPDSLLFFLHTMKRRKRADAAALRSNVSSLDAQIVQVQAALAALQHQHQHVQQQQLCGPDEGVLLCGAAAPEQPLAAASGTASGSGSGGGGAQGGSSGEASPPPQQQQPQQQPQQQQQQQQYGCDDDDMDEDDVEMERRERGGHKRRRLELRRPPSQQQLLLRAGSAGSDVTTTPVPPVAAGARQRALQQQPGGSSELAAAAPEAVAAQWHNVCDKLPVLEAVYDKQKQRWEQQETDRQQQQQQTRQLAVPPDKGQGNGSGSSSGGSSSLSGFLSQFGDDLWAYSRYSRLEARGAVRPPADVLGGGNAMVCAAAFDRDDEYVATAGVSKRIRIFEYGAISGGGGGASSSGGSGGMLVGAGGAGDGLVYPVVELSSRSRLSCVAWSAYVKAQVASSDYEGVVQLWDASTGSELATFEEHAKRAWCVDFSRLEPTRLASSSDDGTAKLWSIHQESSTATLSLHANVCSVQFSPESPHLLAAGAANYRLYLWDLRQTGAPLAAVPGHHRAVSYVRWLGGGQLVSASTDGSVKLWSVPALAAAGAGKEASGAAAAACLGSYGGHTNGRNFIGLSVLPGAPGNLGTTRADTGGNLGGSLGGYIACGSETNEVFCYHTSVPVPMASHHFASPPAWRGLGGAGAAGRRVDGLGDLGDAGPGGGDAFVSAVVWSRRHGTLVAANSAGHIKVLELA